MRKRGQQKKKNPSGFELGGRARDIKEKIGDQGEDASKVYWVVWKGIEKKKEVLQEC